MNSIFRFEVGKEFWTDNFYADWEKEVVNDVLTISCEIVPSSPRSGSTKILGTIAPGTTSQLLEKEALGTSKSAVSAI